MKALFTSILIFAAFFSNAQDNYKTKIDTSQIHRVEVPPEFKGGVRGFDKFLKRNVIYPLQALKDNVQGRVILTFVVEKDGSLTGLRVLRGISAELDAESVRVMNLSPLWTPGTQEGKPVRVQFSIPIAFTLAQK